MAFCEKCGGSIGEGVAFCPTCGAPDQQAEAAQPAYEQPSYQQPAYQQPAYQQPAAAEHPKRALCIVTLVLGICSLVLCWAWYLGLPCAIVGMILGKKALEAGEDGMAKAGRIMSIVGLILGCIFFVIFVIGIIIAASAAASIYSSF